jgi:hypothetical protein
MRKLLGPSLVAALAAAMLLALSAGPALADHVQCGDVITQDTTLTADLNCSGDGLMIAADGVTLDLAGHSITGPGPGSGCAVTACRFYNGVLVGGTGTGQAPRPSVRNVTVENGTIRGFDAGVFGWGGRVQKGFHCRPALA